MSWSGLWKEFVATLVSVGPLVALLLFIKIVLIGSPFENPGKMALGITCSLVGLFIFLQGVGVSLVPLSDDVGRGLADFGRPLILVIVFSVGLAATLVEPGLQTIAGQAEKVSALADPARTIASRTLIHVTALGFACGALLAALKIVYNLPFYWMLAPLLAACVVLAKLASPTFAGLAFDCAGAATGPVNIPVNVAIAIGLSRTVGADPLPAGFGIVGLTSMGSATAVLLFSVLKGV